MNWYSKSSPGVPAVMRTCVPEGTGADMTVVMVDGSG